LAEGDLGRVFQMDAHRQDRSPTACAMGVVIDLAVHDLDVMRFVSGAEITRVFAETERHIHSQRGPADRLVRLSNAPSGRWRSTG
jgi:predicted dehydrogenase